MAHITEAADESKREGPLIYYPGPAFSEYLIAALRFRMARRYSVASFRVLRIACPGSTGLFNGESHDAGGR